MSARTSVRFLGACLALCAFACQRKEPSPTEALNDQPSAAELAAGVEKQSTIAGSVRGTPFDHVAAAFAIESPESEGTTVIYLTSPPLRCIDLSFSGWDRLTATGTLILQLKVLGKRPGRYLAVLPQTLSPGEGTAKWMRSERARVSSEEDAQGGWITIDTLSPRGRVSGSFAVDFSADRLAGSFDAEFCANGHEP